MKKSEILGLSFSYVRETKGFYVYEIDEPDKKLFFPKKVYLNKEAMKTNLPKITITFTSGG